MASKTNAAADTDGEYTVAPGRTITTDDGHKKPGDTVTLSADEAKRLRDLGFILGDDGTRALPSGGPTVNADGVQVTEA